MKCNLRLALRREVLALRCRAPPAQSVRETAIACIREWVVMALAIDLEMDGRMDEHHPIVLE